LLDNAGILPGGDPCLDLPARPGVAIEKGADLPEALASGEVGAIYRKACPIAISIEENSRRLVD
jgi:hypothetical protein